LIRKAFPFLAAFLFASLVAGAHAQTEAPPPTKLQKQLDKLDLSIAGVGIFNNTVSGTILPSAPNQGLEMTQHGSNTLGALVTLRYVAKPYFGFEGNYGYARYTENFSNIGGVQTQANEYTLGYLATPAFTIFDFQPFVSVGAGSIGFRPTPRGGQGLTIQARAAYYYSAGIQKEYFSEHFGFRASFRQLFFLAPDYGQNYLTIKQRTITSEPSVGFYLKF